MKVSVIVPIYGVEQYLRQFLDSILSDPLEDIEFILVNDASPDNSDAVIMSYDDARIKYIKKDVNEGLYKARQDAFDIACGDYIINLDPDDIVSDMFISELYSFAIKNKLDIAVSNVRIIDDFGCVLKNDKSIHFDEDVLFSNSNMGKVFGTPYATWCRMFRRELILAYNYKYVLGELFLTNFHFIDGVLSGVCSSATYFYRKRASSMSSHENSIARLKGAVSSNAMKKFHDSIFSYPMAYHDLVSVFNYSACLKLIYTSCLNDSDSIRYRSLMKELRVMYAIRFNLIMKYIKHMPRELKFFHLLNEIRLIPVIIKSRSFFKNYIGR